MLWQLLIDVFFFTVYYWFLVNLVHSLASLFHEGPKYKHFWLFETNIAASVTQPCNCDVKIDTQKRMDNHISARLYLWTQHFEILIMFPLNKILLLLFSQYLQLWRKKNQSYLADYSKRSRRPDLAEVPHSDTIQYKVLNKDVRKNSIQLFKRMFFSQWVIWMLHIRDMLLSFNLYQCLTHYY